MVRGKVQMRRIENPVHRQVTFCKRRAGLLKKAKELSVLCDAEIGIIVFSSQGKLYELATSGNMDMLIDKYKNASTEAPDSGGGGGGHMYSQEEDAKQEAMLLKQQIDLLQRGLRFIFGDRSTERMTVHELHALEKYLDVWMYNIRSAKMDVMFQEIESLKNKEGLLKAANEFLQEKIVEQNELLDVAHLVADPSVHFGAASIPVTTNPLTIYGQCYNGREADVGISY